MNEIFKNIKLDFDNFCDESDKQIEEIKKYEKHNNKTKN